MNKSALVIDTPENCYDCPFGTAYCGELEYVGYCESKSRPDWCPLKPLPERKEYIVPIDNVESQKDIIAVGWNACINKITGKS
jgi:hypothetical protein